MPVDHVGMHSGVPQASCESSQIRCSAPSVHQHQYDMECRLSCSSSCVCAFNHEGCMRWENCICGLNVARGTWHSCNLTPPARPRYTGTSKWDTAASRTSRIAATSISGVLLLNFGQDLIGLTLRLAGIKALRDRIEHARCATIEC